MGQAAWKSGSASTDWRKALYASCKKNPRSTLSIVLPGHWQEAFLPMPVYSLLPPKEGKVMEEVMRGWQKQSNYFIDCFYFKQSQKCVQNVPQDTCNVGSKSLLPVLRHC